VWSEHFYNDSKRFCEFCVEVTMNCHSTNSDKKPCPETLLQGFFVKSGTNRLKFEQINVQKFIKLDQMDLHWFWWHRHLKSKLVTGIARASETPHVQTSTHHRCYEKVSKNFHRDGHSHFLCPPKGIFSSLPNAGWLHKSRCSGTEETGHACHHPFHFGFDF